MQSVSIMTKLGANVHTLIGVQTKRSFSARWCTEAGKKSSFLLALLLDEAKRSQISPCSCAVADELMEFDETRQNDGEQCEVPSTKQQLLTCLSPD